MTEQEFLDKYPMYQPPPLPRPTALAWLKHLLLLGITFCTATIAGTLYPFGRNYVIPADDPQTLIQFFEFLPCRRSTEL